MFHQATRNFFSEQNLEAKKSWLRHLGIFDFQSRSQSIDRRIGALLDRAAPRPSTRLETSLCRCGKMSEQRYQSIVMNGFGKDGRARCSRKFAVSCRRSPMSH